VIPLCLMLGLLAGAPAPRPPALIAGDPIVTVWYRGSPSGTPKQEELNVIRALGFSGITWPASYTTTVDAVKKMAASAGLQVLVSGAPKGATPESALAPGDRVDIVVTPQNLPILTALAWRAIAHGARVVAFDAESPSGAGLENPDRSLKPWAVAARSLARQFSANNQLIRALTPGPGVIMVPASVAGLDVVMLDADRSWVLVATNASDAPVAAMVRLPAGTPYAIWADLLENSTLAMAGEPAGPRWNLKLDPHVARVYIIDKRQK
jgi:hypothetical protein